MEVVPGGTSVFHATSGATPHCARYLSPRTQLHDRSKQSLTRTELQGIHTAKDVHIFLRARNRIGAYPLFDKVYHICWEGMPADTLTDGL